MSDQLDTFWYILMMGLGRVLGRAVGLGMGWRGAVSAALSSLNL